MSSSPQSIWQLAIRAWRLYLGHLGPFLLPVLVLELPLLLLTVAVLGLLDPGPSALTAEYLLNFTVFALVHSVLTLTEAVLAFLLLAVVAVQVAALAQGGVALTLGGALRRVLPRLWALLGGSALLLFSVGLLTVLGVVLSVVFTLVLAVVNADAQYGGLSGAIQKAATDPQQLALQLFLLMLVAAAAVFLIVKWSQMVQVVVLEDTPPIDALRRSWALVRGSSWRTLGLLLFSSLPITILGNGTLLVEFFGGLPAGDGRALTLSLARGIGLSLRLLVLPWVLTLVTLYYYDLLARGRGPTIGIRDQGSGISVDVADEVAAPGVRGQESGVRGSEG